MIPTPATLAQCRALCRMILSHPGFKAMASTFPTKDHTMARHSTVAYLACLLHADLNQDYFNAGHDIDPDFIDHLLSVYARSLSSCSSALRLDSLPEPD